MNSAVILSGGLDSAVCMSLAASESVAPPLAITFDYGQRARREIDCARRIADHFDSEIMVLALDLASWTGSALVDRCVEVPDACAGGPANIPVTYVAARNIIFLSIALGIAEIRDLDSVYLGVNSVDYSGYPDCRPEFIDAFRNVAATGQKRGVEGRPVDIRTPLIKMSKAEIVQKGHAMNTPFAMTWSCYVDGKQPCERCESCVLRSKGFAESGLADPLDAP